MTPRIKHNLTILRGLLSFQAGTVADPAAAGALEDAGNRLPSMIALHDRLYQSAEFRTMSVSAYIPALVDEIMAGFPKTPAVGAGKRVEEFELPADKPQPLGIILNAILTNCMKCAFTGRESGHITVGAARRPRRSPGLPRESADGRFPESLPGFILDRCGTLPRSVPSSSSRTAMAPIG